MSFVRAECSFLYSPDLLRSPEEEICKIDRGMLEKKGKFK